MRGAGVSRSPGTGDDVADVHTQPRPALWRWHQRLGGAPRYAICLDGDLNAGSSGPSDTFGSPCLAGAEEFGIGRLELWGLL